ncbi:SDR family NAD(P)-dependent oxidoreductase [Micromonospora sp. ATA51]|uniref:SDR family NAD(P)-dependent oxidoreductase n=1 Tax=Micromonospora sp. ATA51 TaxID=2806098 RepID=UPI001A5D24A0|nr:SDR family oxidoreductase [Micromonospora sp. ATA51]MBM0224397.1 SDR family oxidoreductase [Micromonospora sp. ATA51]
MQRTSDWLHDTTGYCYGHVVASRNQEEPVLLEKKNAVIYGASGYIGAEVAQAFAAEGARVFLAGRTRAALEAVAEKIKAAGGVADVATVDVLDEDAVEAHADAVVKNAGSLDISFNLVSLPQTGIQGTQIVDLSPDSFDLPMATYPKANFLTARAAARRMTDQGSGVILMITASPSRTATPRMGGMAPAWAAIESLSRGLAAEVGPHGVRVVCLNAAGMPETPQLTEVYGLHADAYGITRDAFAARIRDLTVRKHLPTVAEIANVAAFVASDRSSAITGAIANLTGGLVVD